MVCGESNCSSLSVLTDDSDYLNTVLITANNIHYLEPTTSRRRLASEDTCEKSGAIGCEYIETEDKQKDGCSIKMEVDFCDPALGEVQVSKVCVERAECASFIEPDNCNKAGCVYDPIDDICSGEVDTEIVSCDCWASVCRREIHTWKWACDGKACVVDKNPRHLKDGEQLCEEFNYNEIEQPCCNEYNLLRAMEYHQNPEECEISCNNDNECHYIDYYTSEFEDDDGGSCELCTHCSDIEIYSERRRLLSLRRQRWLRSAGRGSGYARFLYKLWKLQQQQNISARLQRAMMDEESSDSEDTRKRKTWKLREVQPRQHQHNSQLLGSEYLMTEVVGAKAP
eukprot:UN29461